MLTVEHQISFPPFFQFHCKHATILEVLINMNVIYLSTFLSSPYCTHLAMHAACSVTSTVLSLTARGISNLFGSLAKSLWNVCIVNENRMAAQSKYQSLYNPRTPLSMNHCYYTPLTHQIKFDPFISVVMHENREVLLPKPKAATVYSTHKMKDEELSVSDIRHFVQKERCTNTSPNSQKLRNKLKRSVSDSALLTCCIPKLILVEDENDEEENINETDETVEDIHRDTLITTENQENKENKENKDFDQVTEKDCEISSISLEEVSISSDDTDTGDSNSNSSQSSLLSWFKI